MRSTNKTWNAILGTAILASGVFANVSFADVYSDEEVAKSRPANLSTTEATPLNNLQGSPTGVPTEGEKSNTSRLDVLRRERVRQEVKNEDALQEKLEELRLRDEQKRMQEVMSGQIPQNLTPTAQGSIRNEQFDDQLRLTSASVSRSDYSTRSVLWQVTPRAGLMALTGDSAYRSSPRGSLGIAVGAAAGDVFAGELGFNFAQHGINYASSVPGNVANATNLTGNADVYTLRQNMIEVVGKGYLYNRENRFRPFAAAGIAHNSSTLKTDSRYVDSIRQIYAQSGNRGAAPVTDDVNYKQWMGIIGAGLDYQFSEMIAASVQGRYYGVMNSRITGLQGLGNSFDEEINGNIARDNLARAISRSSMFAINAGVTVTF